MTNDELAGVDDLKKRLRRSVKKPYSAKRGPPPCELQMLDRIAALEAKLAEKDALLRECGEALGPFAENIEYIAFLEAADGDLVDRPPFSAGDYRKAATTLAKIKDATDAD